MPRFASRAIRLPAAAVLLVAAASILAPALPANSLAPSLTDARPAGKTKIALLASDHAGTVTAALGEQVVFGSLVSRRLGAGESIVIVSVEGHKLINGCDANPCIAADQSSTAVSRHYRAFLIRSAPGVVTVLARSNIVLVHWTTLHIDVKITDSTKTLQAATSVHQGSSVNSELRGIPITVTVTLPDGASTAWKSLHVVTLPYGFAPGAGNFLPSPCPGPGPCVRRIPAPDDFFPYSKASEAGIEILVQAWNASDEAIEQTEKPAVVTYRPWKVSVSATNKTGAGATSTESLFIRPNETTTVNATITEPSAQDLLPYMTRLEIRTKRKADTSTDGTMKAECTKQATCKVDLSSGASGLPEEYQAWADVRGLDSNEKGDRPLSGRSNIVALIPLTCTSEAVQARSSRRPHLPAAQTCPAPGNLGIEYFITGGTGDCTPPLDQSGPLQGYQSCSPGKGGTVVFTAWAVTIDRSGPYGIPKYTETALPPGYRFRWDTRNAGLGYIDKCDSGNTRQSPCILTLKDPGTGQIGVEGQLWPDSGTDIISYDGVKVLWAYFS